MAGLGSVRLGSAVARPAVPARRLLFLLVVLCKGCPCCPARRSRVGAAFGRGVFRCGGSARLGCGCGFGFGCRLGVWLWVRWLVLVRVAPFPLFSRFFPSSFLLPP